MKTLTQLLLIQTFIIYINALTYRICHINDFYEARHELVCKAKHKLDRLNCSIITFGGDAFFPSDDAIKTDGLIMPYVLSKLNVKVAVPGNHEFDMGINEAKRLIENDNQIHWLLTNVPDVNFTERYYFDLISNETKNVILFVGLWEQTLTNELTPNLEIEDPASKLNNIIKRVKELYNSYYNFTFVALTHMRINEDITLYQNTDVDLILGGHDHDVVTPLNWDPARVIKSLSDLRQIQVVDIDFNNSRNKYKFSTYAINKDDPCNEDFKKDVEEFIDANGMCLNINGISHDIDTRYVRYSSFNPSIEQVLKKLIDNYEEADMILLNGGIFRGARIFKREELSLSFVLNNKLVMIECDYTNTYDLLWYAMLSCDKSIFDENTTANSAYECRHRGQYFGKIRLHVNYLTATLHNIYPVRNKYKIIITDYLASGKDGYYII